MLQCQLLYKEAESLLERQQTRQALEAFQTLRTLLRDQRVRDPKLSGQVQRHIDSIIDPIGFAAKQQQLQRISRNQARVTEQQIAIDDMSKSADNFFKKGDFAMSVTRYSQAVNLLTRFKQRRPLDLGHAYWNFAMANISWASQLQLTDLNKAALLKEQATLQIQQAILSYPDSAAGRKHQLACQAKLTELTTFLATDKAPSEFIDVEEISSQQIEKPMVLHWKKAMMQRYMQEQPEFNLFTQEVTQTPDLRKPTLS